MPVLYDNALTIRQHYDAPAAASRQTLRLLPPTLAGGQHVAAAAVEAAAIRSLAPDAPHHFLAASPRLPEEPEFADYAHAAVAAGAGAAQAVEAVGLALNRDMAFDAQATEVDTPALEAFRRRRGVCQDFTHAMIACLRALGIPAGYVTGFLRTTPLPGRPRLQGYRMHTSRIRVCFEGCEYAF